MSCKPILSILLFAASAQFTSPASAAGPEPITPIQPAQVRNPAMVELGKQLFFDPRLSKSVSSPAIPAITFPWGERTT